MDKINNHIGKFRFWCQKVLPLVYDDSLSYYELLCKVVAYLNEVVKTTNDNADKLNYYIKLFEDFINTFDIDTYVSDKLDQMAEDGTLDDLIEQTIANYEMVECSMIAEKHIANYLNGGAYIGNNQIVYYCHSNTSNTGELICFNTSTYAELWRYNIELYHGNSVTYNRKLNRLYVAGCYSYDNDETLINKIFEIDLDNPSIISIIIELSHGCYSITYNESTDKYYAVCARGSVSGESNRVYVYDNSFIEETYIDLTPYPFDKPTSTQGIQLSLNNKLYLLAYSPEPCVYVYNLDGELCSCFHIPRIISGYKEVDEPENIIYNFDSNNIIIGFRAISKVSGFNSQCAFMNTNINGSIITHSILNTWDSQYAINCLHNAGASYKPANLTGLITDFYECTIIGQSCGKAVRVELDQNSTPIPGTTYIRNSVMNIFAHNVKFNTIRLLYSTVMLSRAEITGSHVGSNNNEKAGNIVVENSTCSIEFCTLHNSENVYGIISTMNSIVSQYVCNFAYDYNKAYLYEGGSLYGDDHGHICLAWNAGTHRPTIIHRGTVYTGAPTPLNMLQNYDGYVPDVVYFGSGTEAHDLQAFYTDSIRNTVAAYGSIYWSDGLPYERMVKLKLDLTTKTVELLSAQQRQPDGSLQEWDRCGLLIAL